MTCFTKRGGGAALLRLYKGRHLSKPSKGTTLPALQHEGFPPTAGGVALYSKKSVSIRRPHLRPNTLHCQRRRCSKITTQQTPGDLNTQAMVDITTTSCPAQSSTCETNGTAPQLKGACTCTCLSLAARVSLA
ncbi:hypothetical protein E2C01_021678 [Portunus trituberculatus]|uniref:Uncharacterized protein n=1 Tax=Portunus trituberculatus TaxID=210409 RepID=A0A5B7E368_PORTR|nr:hypothetical protein [Portunus trituberculatus]